MEVIRPRDQRAAVEHILFDFDGTISTIRQGWQDVMISYLVEVLLDTPGGALVNDLPGYVRDWVYELTGKQTIYQMIRLADEVTKRGGAARDPLDYKWEYLHRLWDRIQGRVQGLLTGAIAREDMVIHGAYELLDALRARGAKLYLASGTDQVYVNDEAAALGLPAYFGDRIYGAIDDYASYSKAIVIERILTSNNIDGRALAAFGDGYVEIENTKQVGGVAIGVASDEVRRRGIDSWKRERLIGVGADAIIGDYADVPSIIEYLYG
jgi:phosphoglycolate phosphatase